MKRTITLILACASLSLCAQDHGGKKQIDKERADIRTSRANLKRDMAELDAMRAARAEFETQMMEADAEKLQVAKVAILKLMDKEMVQARERLGIDRKEMGRSIDEALLAEKEAKRSKEQSGVKKAMNDEADAKDDRADARDDRNDVQAQMKNMMEMDRLMKSVNKIDVGGDPKGPQTGSVSRLTDEFISLMQKEIFATRREMQEDREEILEDRQEAGEDKRSRERSKK